MTQIFSNDPVVPYKNTSIPALTSKSEIDGLLARWGIKRSAWDWDLENGKVILNFQITETIEGKVVNSVAELKAPVIYNKPTRRNPKLTIDWKCGLRVMWWWTKSMLEYHYLSQSSKTAMFLPFIQGANGKTLEKMLIPRLGEIAQGQLMDSTVEADGEKALEEYKLLKKKEAES